MLGYVQMDKPRSRETPALSVAFTPQVGRPKSGGVRGRRPGSYALAGWTRRCLRQRSIQTMIWVSVATARKSTTSIA